MTDDNLSQQEPQHIGPGQLLREAREKAGLTTEQVARLLNLRSFNIDDIEAERFDNNISVTFTRGYLKAYAKQVNISQEQVLLAFEHLNLEKKEPAKLQSFSRRVAKQASDDRLMLVSYLILGVIVALVVVWWMQQGSDTVTLPKSLENSQETVQQLAADEPAVEDSSDVVEVTPESETIDPALESSADVVAATVDPAIDSAPEDSAVAGDATEQQPAIQEAVETDTGIEDVIVANPPVQDSTTVASAQEATASESDIIESTTPQDELITEQVETIDYSDVEPVELVFEFNDECWMNLTDATGEAIAYGIKAKGRIMPVSGIPPFEVVLGAPEVVSISYQGEVVDMSRFRAGRTARFTLPLDQNQG